VWRRARKSLQVESSGKNPVEAVEIENRDHGSVWMSVAEAGDPVF
jgi:hypothetical protein